MGRFLFAVVLAVCLSHAAAYRWSPWELRDECVCDWGSKGQEWWQRDCYGTDCTQYYEEQARECDCGPILSVGEIAGIVVGGVMFLVLVIILMVWCCYCCGCDCGNRDCMRMCCGCDDGCMMSRWDSEDSLYKGKAMRAPVQQAPVMVQQAPMVQQVPMVQQAPQSTIYVTAAPQRQAPNFAGAVIQQSSQPMFIG